MSLAGRRPDYHDTTCAPSARETRSEPTDQAHRNSTGPVFDRDIELAIGPPRTDGAECRRQHTDIDVVEIGTRCESGFDHVPCTLGIARDQALLEPFGPRGTPTTALPGWGHARTGTSSCARLEVIKIGPSDAPRTAHLGSAQQTQSHIAIGRHVMHAKDIGCFMQRQFLFAHATSCLLNTAHRLLMMNSDPLYNDNVNVEPESD